MITHQTRYRIIYADTDNMGFVYYGNYLRLFEIGRTEIFRDWGLAYKNIEEKGIFLPVSEVFCKFKEPAHYDDVVTIETSLDTRIRGGMKFDYRIWDEANQKIRAHGYTKHACLNRQGRVVRPPKFIQEIIQKKVTSN